MQVGGCKRLARLGAWLGILLATSANAQTFRQMVSAEYVFAADRSFVYTVHREMTPSLNRCCRPPRRRSSL